MSRPSLCVYTVLFSVGEPKANSYVRMFMTWLGCIIRHAKLGRDDRLVIIADEVTGKYLKSEMSLDGVGSLLKCRCDILQMPPVKSLKDGMMWKYTPFQYTQDILLYLDVDVLVMRPLEGFQVGKLYLHKEGDWSHVLYGAGGEGPGFSAGKWACGSQEIRKWLLEGVWRRSQQDKQEYYTIEQPLFNHAVREMQGHWDMTLLSSPVVCSNGTGFDKHKTMLLDLCGTPGDGAFHENKMVTIFNYLWAKGDLD